MEIESSRETLTSKRLLAAKYLLDSRGKIKTLWQQKVEEEILDRKAQKSPVMATALEVFIDELATILKKNPPGPEKISEAARARIYAKENGIKLEYNLAHLLQEFSAVREIIMNELEEANLLVPEVRNPIHKAIDEAMSLAATEFEKNQQQQLRATLARTEVSNRDLEQFAMIAAHDLNSPLATVTSLLGLLTQSIPSNSSQETREYIEFMEQTLTRMRNLVISLLEYARVAQSQTHFQTISMSDVLKDSLQNMRTLIEQSKAVISSDKLPEVYGDRDLLSQVFQNLISNSIKYHGPENPDIKISVTEYDEKCWFFTVKDNGIGFEAQNSEEIFSLYRRLQEKADKPGAGIGLATCRRVIGIHGGTIWAESRRGLGSTFFFTLPKSNF